MNRLLLLSVTEMQYAAYPRLFCEYLVRYVVVALLAMLITQVSAAQILIGPSPYLSFSDSPFNRTPFGDFYLEDFEDSALNTVGVSASSGAVAGPGNFTDSVDGDDGMIDGSGQAGHSWFSQFTTTSFTFTFDAVALGTFPTHVGIVWTDVAFVTSGSFGVGDVDFEAFAPSGTSLGRIGPLSLGDGSSTGETGEDRFFGVIDLGGISALTIQTSNSVDWEVDHLQYGFLDSGIECDFDVDGNCNINDLNAMLSVGPVAPGVPAMGMENFDLTGDGVIDNQDVDLWLAVAGIENSLASPYNRGDANLSGSVDGSDFNLWNSGKFTMSLAWDDGDFNGDGAVDGSDFNLWNGNKFTSSDEISAVPELGTGMLSVFAILLVGAAGIRR